MSEIIFWVIVGLQVCAVVGIIKRKIWGWVLLGIASVGILVSGVLAVFADEVILALYAVGSGAFSLGALLVVLIAIRHPEKSSR